MSTYIKIPRERVGVLIGPGGSVKRDIEERGGAVLRIDSKTGEVGLSLKPNADPVSFWRSVNLVKAIGRGFSPHRAFRILDEEDVMLDIINLRPLVGKSESQLQRVKGRVIGKEGKMRALIEELTGAYVSVYGHTVGLIGGPEQLRIAKEAVMMLIRGCSHKTTLRFLYRAKRELKRARAVRLWHEG